MLKSCYFDYDSTVYSFESYYDDVFRDHGVPHIDALLKNENIMPVFYDNIEEFFGRYPHNTFTDRFAHRQHYLWLIFFYPLCLLTVINIYLFGLYIHYARTLLYFFLFF